MLRNNGPSSMCCLKPKGKGPGPAIDLVPEF